jgi:UDP-glucose:(heptosyl)LPS alpha-1,3-glucosyltransferase
MKVTLLKSKVRHAGGLEKAATRIAQAFTARGAEVTLLSEELMPVPPWRWPSFVRMEQFDQFTRTWLQDNHSDLVFGMDRNRFQTHLRAGNGVHAAFLESRIPAEGRLKWLSCLCNPLHRKILTLEKAAFEQPSLRRLFTNSYFVRRQILERYRVDPQKIQVIHNGVEWYELESAFQEKPARNPDQFRLLFIGNGYRRKGLHVLLDGIARLRCPELHLSVVGKDRHAQDFIRQVARLELQKQVTFFGPQLEIRPFYQQCDALAIPSFYDPFANVTVEALAMGLFVASSKSNGGHEVLTPENGAIIERLDDPDAVAAALRIALRHPKTDESALRIRNSVRSLDFSNQMQLLMDACFGDA